MRLKLPSFQFYPGDWLKDPNLRRCSHAAKGVWMDLLCLMFESEERGVLITSSRAWSDDEVALAVGGDRAVVLSCVQELMLKGVLLRREDGSLYSRRLVRDEHKRVLCKEAGKKGGNPNLTRPTLKGHPKGGFKGASKPNPTPSSSSSSSDEDINKEKEPPPTARPSDVEEALAYAATKSGYEPQIVRHWHASRDSAGWERMNGSPVRNWRSDLDAWVLHGTRQAQHPAPPARSPKPPTRTSQYSW